jgi:histidinol dehydrogenase
LIKILQVRNIDSFVESRRQKTSEKDKKIVQAILNDVRKNGDSAVKKYERKFNGRKTLQLRVSEKEIKEAWSKISREEVIALQTMSARLSNSSPKIQIRGSRKFVAIPSGNENVPIAFSIMLSASS